MRKYNPLNSLFIQNEDKLRLGKIAEYTAYYNGESDALIEFYREGLMRYFNSNPIYTENKRQYFWARSMRSVDIKKQHDPFISSIVDTLTNITGTPIIEGRDEERAKRLSKSILEGGTGFNDLLNGQAIPLTLVQGTGCFKISNDLYENTPILEYYTADRVKYYGVNGRIWGIDFYDYYTDEKGKKYLLIEKRYLTNNEFGNKDLNIDLHLYNWIDINENKGNPEVSLKTLEELNDLRPHTILKNANKLYAIPTTIFADKRGSLYGRSIMEDRVDLLDHLDEAWSIEERVIRKSVPQTYVDESLLPRKTVIRNGQPVLETEPLDDYDRDYVMLEGSMMMDGDGKTRSQGILMNQPQLEVDNYNKTRKRAMLSILNGIMNSASLAITVEEFSNLQSESREREKITVLMRNAIINKLIPICNAVLTDILDMDDYKLNGYLVSSYKPRVDCRFSEFGNPSFEEELKVLGNAWSSGQISTKIYCEELWRDRLSEEEIKAEEERLEKARNLSILAPLAYEGQNVENVEEILSNGNTNIGNENTTTDSR